LRDLSEDTAPPAYEDELAIDPSKGIGNMFNTLSMYAGVNNLKVVGDFDDLHVRDGLSELFNLVFSTRTLKGIVQVSVARRPDKSAEVNRKIRGLEVSLRSVEFTAVEDVDKSEIWTGKINLPAVTTMRGEPSSCLSSVLGPKSLSRMIIPWYANISFEELA
jgi:hypothetical protein